jgi:hypothetical protein
LEHEKPDLFGHTTIFRLDLFVFLEILHINFGNFSKNPIHFQWNMGLDHLLKFLLALSSSPEKLKLGIRKEKIQDIL